MRRIRLSRAPTRELARFTHQLATMLAVGVPPLHAIRVMGDQNLSPRLCGALQRISRALEDGSSLSHAMHGSPTVFDPLYVSLVEAGEASGRLAPTLLLIANQLERADGLRRDVRAAMIYPLCVIVTATGVLLLLLTYVLPTFRDTFADLHGELPWLTRAVFRASDACMTFLPASLVLICSLSYIFFRLGRHAWWRERFDNLVLHVPIIGDLSLKGAIARVTRALGTCLDAGVPILQALSMSFRTAGNRTVMCRLQEASGAITEGYALSEGLARSALLPSMVIEMVVVGETTGRLDTMLNSIATYYEDEVTRSISGLKQLIEPTLIVVLGAIVALLVLAMYLPVFTLGGLVM